jgi:Uma2 family endonuclease
MNMTDQERPMSTVRSKPKKTEYIPPLENGDRLTREEFERRYNAMPHVKKAELINGVVYIVATDSSNGVPGVSSPVRFRRHANPHFRLSGWLVHYQGMTPGTDGADNSTLRLPSQTNETQPDLCLRIQHECGGQSRLSEDDFVEGTPELIVEVAASSATYDLHDKLDAYRRHGAREYLVWRVEEKAIDWFILHRRKLKPLLPQHDGILRSETFPGLWLDSGAMIRDDYKKWFEVLQNGLTSPEHAAFVARLQRRRARKRR